MKPSPFDHGPRSSSLLILYSELPICNIGPYPPSLAPHVTFPLVDGFAPKSPLNPTTATVPSSVGPLLFKFINHSWRENQGNYSQEFFTRYPDTFKLVKVVFDILHEKRSLSPSDATEIEKSSVLIQLACDSSRSGNFQCDYAVLGKLYRASSKLWSSTLYRTCWSLHVISKDGSTWFQAQMWPRGNWIQLK